MTEEGKRIPLVWAESPARPLRGTSEAGEASSDTPTPKSHLPTYTLSLAPLGVWEPRVPFLWASGPVCTAGELGEGLSAGAHATPLGPSEMS